MRGLGTGFTLIVSLVVGLAISEVIVRTTITTNADGQDFFFDEPIRPYRISLHKSRDLLDSYISSSTSYIKYDPLLGWVQRSNSSSTNGLYRSNSDGIRSDREYSRTPASGVIRIALFGDSYTHSSDVEFQHSWGNILQESLNERGWNVEVLNFGVGGYGMDQAYLRWLTQGKHFNPHIVIFGFRAPDALRNVNVLRSIYSPGTEVPFSKPRFVIDGEQLRIVNSPTIPLEELHDVLANFSEHEISRYEYFFDDSYHQHWWQASKLLSVAYHFLTPRESFRPSKRRMNESAYRLDGEIGQLAIAIVDSFAKDVEATGAKFMMVNLPARRDINRLFNGESFVYSDLLSKLDDKYVVSRIENAVSRDELKHFSGHYSPKGNRIAAKAMLEDVSRLLE